MRATRTIELSPGRDAAIQEARVCDMRRLLSILPDDLASTDLIGFVRRHVPDLITVLGDCVILPLGEGINDLSLSECEAVMTTWWEMHQGFFHRALAVVGYPGSVSPDPPPSTAPV